MENRDLKNLDKYKIDVFNLSNRKKDKLLINWLFEHSTTFCLIETINSALSEFTNSFIDELTPFLISKHNVNSWPGMFFYGGDEYGGMQYRFRCTSEAKNTVLSYIQSIKQFIMPEMLEDISFYSENNEVVFYSIIHEEMAYIVNLDKIDAKKNCGNIRGQLLSYKRR